MILTQISQQGESFRKKYAEIDENNDGLVDILEFEEAMQALDMDLEFDQIFDMFYRFDKNHSGLIEMEEFT